MAPLVFAKRGFRPGYMATIPIHKLLSRIRWDPRFRAGEFALGYFDRIERRIKTVPLARVHFPVEAPAMFDVWDADGHLHRIPFHRVRRVVRNGRLISQRTPAGE